MRKDLKNNSTQERSPFQLSPHFSCGAHLFYAAVRCWEISVLPVTHSKVEEAMEVFEVSFIVPGRGLDVPVDVVLARVPASWQILEIERSLVKHDGSEFSYAINT